MDRPNFMGTSSRSFWTGLQAGDGSAGRLGERRDADVEAVQIGPIASHGPCFVAGRHAFDDARDSPVAEGDVKRKGRDVLPGARRVSFGQLVSSGKAREGGERH